MEEAAVKLRKPHTHTANTDVVNTKLCHLPTYIKYIQCIDFSTYRNHSHVYSQTVLYSQQGWFTHTRSQKISILPRMFCFIESKKCNYLKTKGLLLQGSVQVLITHTGRRWQWRSMGTMVNCEVALESLLLYNERYI